MRDVSELIKFIDRPKVFEKMLGGALIVSKRFRKNISWDSSLYHLVLAHLTVGASQTATSGAEIEVFVNNEKLDDVNWHALETNYKTKGYRVNLLNGENVIELRYKVTAYNPGGAEALLDELLIDLLYRPTSKATNVGRTQITKPRTVIEEGSTEKKVKDSLDKIGNNVWTILAGLAVIGVVFYIADQTILKKVGGLKGMIQNFKGK